MPWLKPPLPEIISQSDLNLRAEMTAISVNRRGLEIMAAKGTFLIAKLRQVKAPAANILKQEMLAKGGEAAVGHGSIYGRDTITDVLLMGTGRQFERLLERLSEQPFGLKQIGTNLRLALANYQNPGLFWRVGRQKINLADRILIMGVLNITPDSFYDGGRYQGLAAAVIKGKEMLTAGSKIIDVGGESSRPGSEPVPLREELNRVIPVIKKLAPLAKAKKAFISIDTYKAKVAEAAVKAGASIINDISGGRFDKDILRVTARTGTSLVLMHIKGTPKNMQLNPRYQDLMGEILDYLAESIFLAEQAGVSREKIAVDPGLGFGKTAADNLTIIKRLAGLRTLGRPILIGPSRKSFIGQILKDTLPEERLFGTAAACALAVQGGARILRVHDPAEISQVAAVALAIGREKIS